MALVHGMPRPLPGIDAFLSKYCHADDADIAGFAMAEIRVGTGD